MIPEEDFQRLLDELNEVPREELREVMSECFTALTLDTTSEGPITPILSNIDLMVKVWNKHMTSDNAELRDAAYRVVGVLKEVKKEIRRTTHA